MTRGGFGYHLKPPTTSPSGSTSNTLASSYGGINLTNLIMNTSLRKKYVFHAASLRLTGAGVDQDDDERVLGGAPPGHIFLEDYVPPLGPDQTTHPVIKNIWQKIVIEFPFFPSLHKFLSTRPNVVPIAVTTGLGPQHQEKPLLVKLYDYE
ncbi:hypothetical protein BXZ70DRAFT_1009277 [Cristinia sonorae]|uniref:Uncharacterized protein n=1 Tax=Cristinia sonorae TaxID=1940300 RepID=A0A8K0ULX8_9AGAR|nr:hypothetical protein BXZ70DRAFT_1009277 [Cristinia sonorae]